MLNYRKVISWSSPFPTLCPPSGPRPRFRSESISASQAAFQIASLLAITRSVRRSSMPKYSVPSAYSSYVNQLNGASPPPSATESTAAEPEPALIPYPLGAAGHSADVSTRYLDLGLGLSAESMSKAVPDVLPPNLALIRWGHEAGQGEVSQLSFYLPTREVRIAFGAPPSDPSTFPMLWIPDPALADEGVLDPALLAAIAGQLHAPRFDVFDVTVHVDTKDLARAEALLLQLFAGGVLRQWPARDSGADEEPPTISFKLRKSNDVVSSSRFSTQLPVGELTRLRQDGWLAQLVSPDVSGSHVPAGDRPRALFWRAVFCWLHSVHHSDSRWAQLPDGSRFRIELSVGNFPSLRSLYLITDPRSAHAHACSVFGCPPDALHLRALVIPTAQAQGWPIQPGASTRGSRSAGGGPENRCWIWTYSADDAMRLMLCSPFAQVQGPQLSHQLYCPCAVSLEFQHTKLPARLPLVSAPPASANQLVLRSQALQISVLVVVGNLIKPGSATEAVARGVFHARVGRVLDDILLEGTGYDSWKDFFDARLQRHPPSTDSSARIHGLLLALDLDRECERRICWSLWESGANGRLGMGFESNPVFVRLRDCVCEVHLGRGRSRCLLRHVNCIGHGHKQIQCHICLGPGHFAEECPEAKSRPRLYNGKAKPVCAGCRQLSCDRSLFTCVPDVDYVQDVLEGRCSLHQCCHHAADQCPLAQCWPPVLLDEVCSALHITAHTIKGGSAMSLGDLFVARMHELHARCARNRRGPGRQVTDPTVDVFGSPVPPPPPAWGSGSKTVSIRSPTASRSRAVVPGSRSPQAPGGGVLELPGSPGQQMAAMRAIVMQDVERELAKKVTPLREAAERTTTAVTRLSEDLAKSEASALRERARVESQRLVDTAALRKEMEDARAAATVEAEAARTQAERLDAMCKSVVTTLSMHGDILLAGDDPRDKAAGVQKLVKHQKDLLAEEDAAAEAALLARHKKRQMLNAASDSLDKELGGGKRAAPDAASDANAKRKPETPSPAHSSASTAPLSTPPPSAAPMDTDASPLVTPPGQKPPVCPRCLGDDAVHDPEACSAPCAACGWRNRCLVGCDFARRFHTAGGVMRRVVLDPDALRHREVAIRSRSESYSTMVEASISLHAPSASLLQSSEFVTSPDRAWAADLAASCFISREEAIYCYIPSVAVTLSGENYWVRLVDEASGAATDPLANAAAALIRGRFAKLLETSQVFTTPLHGWDDGLHGLRFVAFVLQAYVSAVREAVALYGITRAVTLLDVREIFHLGSAQLSLGPDDCEAAKTVLAPVVALCRSMSAAVHVLVLADSLASCRLDSDARPFPPHCVPWRNPYCAPVRDHDGNFTPEPFLVRRLTIAALCVVAGHSIPSLAPAQPLLEAFYTNQSPEIQAALCVSALVADVALHEFHDDSSSFLGLCGPMVPAAALPPSLQWWLCVLSRALDASAALTPSQIQAGAADDTPAYKFLSAVRLGIRSAVEQFNSTGYQAEFQSVDALRSLGCLLHSEPPLRAGSGGIAGLGPRPLDFFVPAPHVMVAIGSQVKSGDTRSSADSCEADSLLRVGALIAPRLFGPDSLFALAELPVPDRLDSSWAMTAGSDAGCLYIPASLGFPPAASGGASATNCAPMRDG